MRSLTDGRGWALRNRGAGPVLGARGPEIARGLEVREAAEQGLVRAWACLVVGIDHQVT